LSGWIRDRLAEATGHADNGGVADVLHVLTTPRLWPEWPYLRIERRTELRPGSPFCVVVANELHDVDPTVYFTDDWPVSDDTDLHRDRAMEYSSLDEIASAGWKPFYLVS